VYQSLDKVAWLAYVAAYDKRHGIEYHPIGERTSCDCCSYNAWRDETVSHSEELSCTSMILALITGAQAMAALYAWTALGTHPINLLFSILGN
jgi:hypothetical protein